VRVLKFDGAAAPRVLRFDTAFGREGCGGACGAIIYRLAAVLVRTPPKDWGSPLFIKPSQPPWRAKGKHANRASPVGNAPLLPTAPPPAGEVYATLSF
jgi:hypothetical protein